MFDRLKEILGEKAPSEEGKKEEEEGKSGSAEKQRRKTEEEEDVRVHSSQPDVRYVFYYNAQRVEPTTTIFDMSVTRARDRRIDAPNVIHFYIEDTKDGRVGGSAEKRKRGVTSEEELTEPSEDCTSLVSMLSEELKGAEDGMPLERVLLRVLSVVNFIYREQKALVAGEAFSA